MDLNFKEWLFETDQNIQYGGFWSDGSIIVHIHKTRYVFVTDAAYHSRWKKMYRYQPWNVLNEIKLQVKNGHAQQIEPQPAAQPEKMQTNSKIPPQNKQKTLF